MMITDSCEPSEFILMLYLPSAHLHSTDIKQRININISIKQKSKIYVFACLLILCYNEKVYHRSLIFISSHNASTLILQIALGILCIFCNEVQKNKQSFVCILCIHICVVAIEQNFVFRLRVWLGNSYTVYIPIPTFIYTQ